MFERATVSLFPLSRFLERAILRVSEMKAGSDFNVSRVTGEVSDAPTDPTYIPLNSRRVFLCHNALQHSSSRCNPITQIPGTTVGVRRRKPGDEFPSPITSIFHTDRRAPRFVSPRPASPHRVPFHLIPSRLATLRSGYPANLRPVLDVSPRNRFQPIADPPPGAAAPRVLRRGGGDLYSLHPMSSIPGRVRGTRRD